MHCHSLSLSFLFFTYALSCALASDLDFNLDLKSFAVQDDVKRKQCDGSCGSYRMRDGVGAYPVSLECYADAFWAVYIYQPGDVECAGSPLNAMPITQGGGCDCKDIGFATWKDFPDLKCKGKPSLVVKQFPVLVDEAVCALEMPLLGKCQTTSAPQGVAQRGTKLTGCGPFYPPPQGEDEEEEEEEDDDEDYEVIVREDPLLKQAEAMMEKLLAGIDSNDFKLADSMVSMESKNIQSDFQQMMMTVGIPLALISSAALVYKYGKCMKKDVQSAKFDANYGATTGV